jgi:hypothetical protein
MSTTWLLGRGTQIRTWPQFARRVRRQGCILLRELDRFPDAILVTGCQRSGTTIMARIITGSDGMINYWFGRDDELDAALILSGTVAHANRGRYCFQTTYVNECVHEYLERVRTQKIIWVLRDPVSVTASMLYHWRRFALNELFDACGAALLPDRERQLYARFGKLAIPRLTRACMAYNGKLNQLFTLTQYFSTRSLAVIDYNDLIADRHRLLRKVYDFIDLPYREAYGQQLRSGGKSKSRRLSSRQRRVVETLCTPVYERAGRVAHFLGPADRPAPADCA